MHPINTISNTVQDKKHPSSYREVKIGKTLYCVTSEFIGEKELGSTLEKLAAQHVLEKMDCRAKELLRS